MTARIPADYATPEDVYDQADNPTREALDEMEPQVVQRLVTLSSRRVRWHTRAARYRTDGQYLPVDPALRAAMAEATISQVLAVVAGGLASDVLSGGVNAEPVVTSSSENGASITIDTSTADNARAHIIAGGLCAEAEMILGSVGLLSGFPYISM